MVSQDGPFALDVDPEKLRAAARRLRAMAQDAGPRGERISRTPDDIGSSWTGRTAQSVKTEMRGLGAHLTGFADDLRDTRQAVTTLAQRYDEALEEVASLNTQWEAADAEHGAATRRADSAASERRAVRLPGMPPVLDLERLADLSAADRARDAERRRLEREFDRLREDVRRDTRTCARVLSQHVPLPVPPTAVGLYRQFGVHGMVLDRSEFNARMPLSEQVDHSAREQVRSEQEEGPGISPPSFWDALGAGVEWHDLSVEQRLAVLNRGSVQLRGRAEGAHRRYREYLRNPTAANRHAYEEFLTLSRRADGLDRQAATVGSKVLRSVPGIGWVITGAGVGHEIHQGAPADRTIVSALAGVGAGAGVVALAATAPVSVPTLAVVAVAAGVGWAATEGVKAAWDSEIGQEVVNGVKDLGKSIGGGVKSAWKGVFG